MRRGQLAGPPRSVLVVSRATSRARVGDAAWSGRTRTQAASGPGPAGHSRGSSDSHASRPHGAARVERAARRQRRAGRAGHRAGPAGAAARPGRRRSGTPRRAPGCRGAVARWNTSAAGPTSTTRPAYITASRSQVSASTDRSWLIISRLMPDSGDQVVDQPEDLGLHHHVERGRRLVGDDQRRARRPAPSRSSRAGAAHRRARAGRHRRAPAATRPASSSSRTPPVRGRRGRTSLRGSRIGSAIWSPMRCTGLSECMAPWNTIDAPAQRTARSRPQLMVEDVLAVEQHAAGHGRASPGSSRSSARARVDLPEPDSPATPSFSPRPRVRSTPRTAGTSPPWVR